MPNDFRFFFNRVFEPKLLERSKDITLDENIHNPLTRGGQAKHVHIVTGWEVTSDSSPITNGACFFFFFFFFFFFDKGA